MDSLKNSALENVLLGTVELIKVHVWFLKKSQADWWKLQPIKKWYFFLYAIMQNTGLKPIISVWVWVSFLKLFLDVGEWSILCAVDITHKILVQTVEIIGHFMFTPIKWKYTFWIRGQGHIFQMLITFVLIGLGTLFLAQRYYKNQLCLIKQSWKSVYRCPLIMF